MGALPLWASHRGQRPARHAPRRKRGRKQLPFVGAVRVDGNVDNACTLHGRLGDTSRPSQGRAPVVAIISSVSVKSAKRYSVHDLGLLWRAKGTIVKDRPMGRFREILTSAPGHSEHMIVHCCTVACCLVCVISPLGRERAQAAGRAPRLRVGRGSRGRGGSRGLLGRQQQRPALHYRCCSAGCRCRYDYCCCLARFAFCRSRTGVVLSGTGEVDRM